MTTSSIPYELDAHCRRVSAETVARCMDRGELQKEPNPGRCRFCRRDLPVKTVQFDVLGATVNYPIEQCDRVAQLHDEACRIHNKWKMERIQAAQQKKPEKKWEL